MVQALSSEQLEGTQDGKGVDEGVEEGEIEGRGEGVELGEAAIDGEGTTLGLCAQQSVRAIITIKIVFILSGRELRINSSLWIQISQQG